MQTRCDYHTCPECECAVVHIVQDGNCYERDFILCEACAAADVEPDHDCLLPLMCGQRDPMSVAYGFTPDTDDTVYCANVPSDDDAEGCTPPVDEWTRTRNAPIASDPARPLDYLATFERALRGRD